MEMSALYHIRDQKMASQEIPSISEVKSQLGENLTKIFIEQCPDSLIKLMSLEPLIGPGEDLWMSPSDILINKVVLKPPLTNKHIKALTHQGILDIGQKIEEKFIHELDLKIAKELYDQEEKLNFMADRNLNYALANQKKEQDRYFGKLIKQMNDAFDIRLKKNLDQLTADLSEDYNHMCEEATKKMISDKEVEWKEKLEVAVASTVATLSKQFLIDLKMQEKELTNKFIAMNNRQKLLYENIVKQEQLLCKTTLKQLKHNLQCNNIANLMYILCVERRKCLQEHTTIVNKYKELMNNLQHDIAIKNKSIDKLTAERNYQERQANLREECLLQVIRQFQKFINYALKASPTQAEFLLSVEKMMMFELTQAILHSDEFDQKYLKTLMAWKSDSHLSSKSSKSGLSPDFHNCLNEVNKPKSNPNSSNVSNDVLPTIYYKDGMYVREDFRNMFSQGLSVSSDNLLWNKDVEHLMLILRRSASKVDHSDIKSEHHHQQLSQSPRRSSVRFGNDENVSTETLLELETSLTNKTLIKPKEPSFEKPARISDSSSGKIGISILGAQDSLDLNQKKSNTQIIKLESEDSDQFSANAKQSSRVTIQLNPGELKTHKHEDVIPTKKESFTVRKQSLSGVSRISLATDSLECYFKTKVKHHDSDIMALVDTSLKEESHLITYKYEETLEKLEHSKAMPILETKKMSQLDVPSDNPWMIYESSNKSSKSSQNIKLRENFLKKKNKTKIIGNPKDNDHLGTSTDFATHRIHSIIDVLKKDHSLMRIFTSCSQ